MNHIRGGGVIVRVTVQDNCIKPSGYSVCETCICETNVCVESLACGGGFPTNNELCPVIRPDTEYGCGYSHECVIKDTGTCDTLQECHTI